MNSALAASEVEQIGRYDIATQRMDRRSKTDNGMMGDCKSVSTPELSIGARNCSLETLTPPVVLGNMVGRSPAMQEVFSMNSETGAKFGACTNRRTKRKRQGTGRP
jgi:hypothetical protein